MSDYLNLLFHEVVDNPNESGLVRKSALPYKHTPKQFEAYLEEIFRYGDAVITPEDSTWPTNQNNLSITFDDGGVSNLKSAELLEKKGYKGVFFVVTELIGSKGFLIKNDIRDLSNRGHVIGSHSHTHPNVFKSLSSKDMFYEWKTSKNILEDLLGKEIKTCSIPGGDASQLAYTVASEAGYEKLFDSEPILSQRQLNGLKIYGRLCVKTTHSTHDLKSWLNGSGVKKYKRIWETKKALKKIGYPLYKLKRNLDRHG
jgi:peptidoglycan/xylan/chitin deacetylase (PgdA/CDA1 family)